VPRTELVVACSQLDALLGDPGGARRRLLTALEPIPREHGAALAVELAALATTTTERRGWLRHVRGADPLVTTGADALAAVADRDLEAIDRAAARLRELNDSTLAAQLTVVARIARAQLELERLQDAAETTDRALAIAHRTQRQEALVELLELRATNLLLALELDGALREAEAAERLARSQEARHMAWLRAVILHHRGDVVAAERVAAAVEQPDAVGACELAAIREPELCLRETVPRPARLDPLSSSRLLPALARAAVAAGRLDDAERWAVAIDPALPLSNARASYARAELLLARGEAAAAARLADDTVTVAERLRARLDAAEARLLAGRAHAAAGDDEQAKRALQQVAADAARGGALRLRDAAARELRRIGSRVSARAHRDGQLTGRERTVAELVADGHSNKQVAAALFLSEGTIENTLTRVYAKLGIRSRTQLARTLAPESRRLP
jgi:DNA-binding CsgD family transcriptional regulator